MATLLPPPASSPRCDNKILFLSLCNVLIECLALDRLIISVQSSKMSVHLEDEDENCNGQLPTALYVFGVSCNLLGAVAWQKADNSTHINTHSTHTYKHTHTHIHICITHT